MVKPLDDRAPGAYLARVTTAEIPFADGSRLALQGGRWVLVCDDEGESLAREWLELESPGSRPARPFPLRDRAERPTLVG